MIDLDVWAVLAILAGAGIGTAAWSVRTAVRRAVRANLELVARRIDDDRAALAALPPGLLSADVWAHAARTGMTLREAAADLFAAQARARLSANVRHHHGRPWRPR
jgi:type II secretory pathway pseudopilin PulG